MLPFHDDKRYNYPYHNLERPSVSFAPFQLERGLEFSNLGDTYKPNYKHIGWRNFYQWKMYFRSCTEEEQTCV